MILEMVQTLSKDSVLNTVLVLKIFIRLGPPQIDKQIFTVVHLYPKISSFDNSFDEFTVVAGA